MDIGSEEETTTGAEVVQAGLSGSGRTALPGSLAMPLLRPQLMMKEKHSDILDTLWK